MSYKVKISPVSSEIEESKILKRFEDLSLISHELQGDTLILEFDKEIDADGIYYEYDHARLWGQDVDTEML